MIYLDNAATSGRKPADVIIAVRNALSNPVNVGRGSGKTVFLVAEKIFRAREKICELLNVDTPENIIFTNNATMALNIAYKGIVENGDHIIATMIEHNAILRQLHSDKGITFDLLPCNEFGFVDFGSLADSAKPTTKLLIVNVVSNVTGAIQDYKSIYKIANKHNLTLLFDFSQAAGNIEIDLNGFKKCMAAFSGHKSLLGPQGTGVLYVSPDLELKTVLQGGTGSMSEILIQPDLLPDRFEVGTINTPGILGLYEGVSRVLKAKKLYDNKIILAKELYDGLTKIKGVKIYHSGDFDKHTAIISFNISDLHSEEVAEVLAKKYGISVRGGFHCAPFAHKAIDTNDIGAVRVSLGYQNTSREIKKFIKAVDEIARA